MACPHKDGRIYTDLDAASTPLVSEDDSDIDTPRGDSPDDLPRQGSGVLRHQYKTMGLGQRYDIPQSPSSDSFSGARSAPPPLIRMSARDHNLLGGMSDIFGTDAGAQVSGGSPRGPRPPLNLPNIRTQGIVDEEEFKAEEAGESTDSSGSEIALTPSLSAASSPVSPQPMSRPQLGRLQNKVMRLTKGELEVIGVPSPTGNNDEFFVPVLKRANAGPFNFAQPDGNQDAMNAVQGSSPQTASNSPTRKMYDQRGCKFSINDFIGITDAKYKHEDVDLDEEFDELVQEADAASQNNVGIAQNPAAAPTGHLTLSRDNGPRPRRLAETGSCIGTLSIFPVALLVGYFVRRCLRKNNATHEH